MKMLPAGNSGFKTTRAIGAPLPHYFVRAQKNDSKNTDVVRGDVLLKRRSAIFAQASLFACALAFAGCEILPATGPVSANIRAEQPANPDNLPYAFVKVTPATVSVLEKSAPRLSNDFIDRRPPSEIRLGVGDIVSVTIFEAGAGGLFIPAEAGVRPGNFITLPNQAVDSKGNISIPYAGVGIRAAGRTPTEIQQAIVDSIKNRAIDPQAVVSVTDQRTSLISVLGDVKTASRFPANAAGEHILDAITRAGGPSSPGFDTWVLLERGGRRALSPFGALVYDPPSNIWAHPGDTIYVFSQPQTFVAFGASGQQGQFNFNAWRISLAEAIGKAGGLNDNLADPASAFLYRGETREVARRLGVDVSKFEGPIVPIIYNINLRDPAGYLLATQLEMRNKDVLYISNALSVETSKFLNYLRLIIATVNDPITAANNAYILKAAIKGTTSTPVIVTSPISSGNSTTSDITLKQNISLLGRLDNGLGFYRFNYIGSETAYVGVMAQEVQVVMPDAVERGRDGYLRVFYDKLGLKFQTYDAWLASGARIPTTRH